MIDRALVDARIREHYERVWSADDAWQFEGSPFERDRHDFLTSLIHDRRSASAVEIGCRSGCFTTRLGRLTDRSWRSVS